MKEIFPAADSAYFTAFAMILVFVFVVVKPTNGAKVVGELYLAFHAVPPHRLTTRALYALRR